MKIIIDAKNTNLSEDRLWQLVGLIDTVLGFAGISSTEECSFQFINVVQPQQGESGNSNPSGPPTSAKSSAGATDKHICSLGNNSFCVYRFIVTAKCTVDKPECPNKRLLT